MKKMMMLTIMAVTFGILVTNNARAGVIEERMLKQHWRIKQGIRSGELVHFEVKILKQEQHRIKQAKRYVRSDGRFTRKERRQITKMQDHAGRHIYRLKHNHIRRYGRHHYSHGHQHKAMRY